MIDTAALSQEELLLLIELRRQCQRANAASLQSHQHHDRTIPTPSLRIEQPGAQHPATSR